MARGVFVGCLLGALGAGGGSNGTGDSVPAPARSCAPPRLGNRAMHGPGCGWREVETVAWGLEREPVRLRARAAWQRAKSVVPPEAALLIPAAGESGDQIGFAVSIHGGHALAGAFADPAGGDLAGAAWLFEFDGAAWRETAKLVAPGAAAEDFFGFAVATRGDRAVAGAFGADGERGAVHVFRRVGGQWGHEATLTASDSAPFQDFGTSVAIHGGRIAVGAFGDADNGTFAGAVYVFELVGDTWTETAKLKPPDAAPGDNFGVAVALDGDRLLAGADGDDDAGPSSGAAWVFRHDGNSWLAEAKLTPSAGAAQDFFGAAVALDGRQALVGAPLDDGVATGAGAAWLFSAEGPGWAEVATFRASDAEPFDGFGASVALDGDLAFVGAFDEDERGSGAGAVYEFARGTAGWVERAKLVAADGTAGDGYGISVSAESGRVLVGASGREANRGAAYAFSRSSAAHPYLLLARTSIVLDRQADMIGDAHSNGSMRFLAGAPSRLVGRVTALGDVVLDTMQTVEGDVVAGGAVALAAGATVTGTVSVPAPVPPVPLPDPVFTAGGAKVVVLPRRELVLLPGVYGEVDVRPQGTLVLFNDGAVGDYFMDALLVQNRATIVTAVTEGPVRVHVVGSIDFRQEVAVMSTPVAAADRITWFVRGDALFGAGSSVLGRVVASRGLALLGEATSLRGSACADTIELAPGARVVLP